MLFANHLYSANLPAAPEQQDGKISSVCTLGHESIFPRPILQWEYQLLSHADEARLCVAFSAIMPIAISAQAHLKVNAYLC